MGKLPLQLFTELERMDKSSQIPSVIVTNDWMTGLVPAYRYYNHYPNFKSTKFMHLIHNLGISYEGRIYPESRAVELIDNLEYLPRDPRIRC